jgi:hypothetical protein
MSTLVLATLLIHLLLASQSRADLSDAVINTNGCSGVIIVADDSVAYGVSAAHCWTSPGMRFDFTTKSSKRGRATILKLNQTHDLAFFQTDAKSIDGVAPVISGIPANAQWTAAGASNSTGLHTMALLFVTLHDITTDQGATIRDRLQFRLTSGAFRPGDSGGAVFAASATSPTGGLAGVISHNVGKNDWSGLHASSNRSLLAFLKECEPAMQPQCRNGYCYVLTAPQSRSSVQVQVPGPPPETHRTGQHGLPDYMDTDAERGALIAKLLEQHDAMAARIDQLEQELRSLKLTAPPGPPSEPIAGKTGPAGPPGESGPAGRDGRDGKDAIVDEASIMRLLMQHLPGQRVVLVEGSKILDDETYKPGEPIVLDRSVLTRKGTE